MWELILECATAVAAVSAGIGAVVGFIVAVRKAWPFVVRFVVLVNSLSTLPDDLAFIKHELDTNSGKSVKDIAMRTESAVAALTADVAQVKKQSSELSDDVAHVKRQAASLKTTASRTNRRLTDHIANGAS